MANQEEKIIPEAEEAKVEETATPEVKTEEKKAPKKANGKVLGIVAAAVAGVAVIALLVIALVSGSSAISAFKAEDYEKAYNASKMAWFMNGSDKDTIKVGYIQNVLCKEGAFYEAYELLEKAGLSEKEKEKVYEKNGNLAMCKKGQIATFGTLDTEPVEWLVLDVKTVKIDGKKRAQALLMTKDIIGTSVGWGEGTKYSKSTLHDYCDINFKSQFAMSLTNEQQKSLCQTKIKTGDDEVTAWAFAPSKEDIETYLVDDMAQYIAAAPTKGAKAFGVIGPAASKYASYYLRDLGKISGETQFASGVNHEGKISDGFNKDSKAIGARVCINVDLGEI